MYRTASYFRSEHYAKTHLYEQLAVNVYEDSSCQRMVLRVLVNFDAKLQSISLIPMSYQGYSFNVMSHEMFLAQSFISEKNWRNRCKDYEYIVNSL